MAVRVFIRTVEQSIGWGREWKRFPGLVFDASPRDDSSWRPLTADEFERLTRKEFCIVRKVEWRGEAVDQRSAAPEDEELGADYFRMYGPYEIQSLRWMRCMDCDRLFDAWTRSMDYCPKCDLRRRRQRESRKPFED